MLSLNVYKAEQVALRGKHLYCIWILTWNFGINYMDQCITK